MTLVLKMEQKEQHDLGTRLLAATQSIFGTTPGKLPRDTCCRFGPDSVENKLSQIDAALFCFQNKVAGLVVPSSDQLTLISTNGVQHGNSGSA